MEIIDRVASFVDSDRIVVAYSGGADSTALMWMLSHRSDCVGVFVDSPLLSERLRRIALSNAEHLGLNVIVKRIDWNELGNAALNDGSRCYHCKKAIYRRVRDVADGMDVTTCVDGENADDLSDDRPGRVAAREFGVISPLSSLGIGRGEIESVLSKIDLKERIVKDTCMATRIPFGTPICEDIMRRVESLEDRVRKITNVDQLRVRIVDDTAKIQTSFTEIPKLFAKDDELNDMFVENMLKMTIDKEGYEKKV